MRKKKIGFALGSGGARGVAHIGFLQAMEEAGIKPDYISGCSMGSVVGMAYSAGMTPEQMRDVAFSLRLRDLIEVTNRPGGLFDTRKVRKLLMNNVGDPEFKDLKIPFRCVAVDMFSQKLVEFSEGKVLDAVVASSTIPGVFKPLEFGGMRLVDGGVLDRVPIETLTNMGAKQIVAVDVLGQKPYKEKRQSPFTLLFDVFDIIDNQRTAHNKDLHNKNIKVWIEPDLGAMSQYSLKGIKTAYEKGYEVGKAHTEEILKLL